MTAEPLGSLSWYPDPARQLRADYTVQDLLDLPGYAPRVELRDGVMIVVPSPAFGHQRRSFRICQWLEQHAPPGQFEPIENVGVKISAKDTFQPDVLLLRSPVENYDDHLFTAESVVLAVEIVSPGTRRRDRFEKPADYAAAGIPHYWRVEQDPVHIFAYQLGLDGTYKLMADSTDVLVLDEPFEIRLRVRDIAR